MKYFAIHLTTFAISVTLLTPVFLPLVRLAVLMV